MQQGKEIVVARIARIRSASRPPVNVTGSMAYAATSPNERLAAMRSAMSPSESGVARMPCAMFCDHMRAMPAGSPTGIAGKRTALLKLKDVVFSPMPSARISAAPSREPAILSSASDRRRGHPATTRRARHASSTRIDRSSALTHSERTRATSPNRRAASTTRLVL